jgi:CBS domain-containing protein
MLCQEIMKKDVECLTVNDTAQVAARKMRDSNVGFLPVCDQSKKVLGTITDRDLAIRLIAENRPPTTTVGELMTREVVYCRPQDDIQRAEQLMAQKHKARILCCDGGGKLVGVISLSDLAQRDDDGRVAETLRRVSEREAHAPI